MEQDSIIQATGYANFLMALGGASMTVLALISGFKKKSGGSRLYASLVGGLLVATIACFVGVHLMTITQSLSRDTTAIILDSAAIDQDSKVAAPHLQKLAADVKVLDRDRELGPKRLLTVASANSFIAAVLFLFSLVLLPKAFEADLPDNLDNFLFYIFFAIEAALFLDMSSFVCHLHVPGGPWVLIPAVLGGLMLYFGSYPNYKKRDDFIIFPFVLCAVFCAMSLVLFAVTSGAAIEPSLLDITCYSFSMTLPAGALLRLAREIRRKHKTPHGEHHESPHLITPGQS